MSHLVKLETFEGPLDLLLHLIRKNDMDIAEIEVSKITAQYLEFINAMRVLDVDLASEFIVMAATLIYIKSKAILPRSEEEAEEEEITSREDLIRRLIEYQKYKMASEEMIKRPLLNTDLFKVHLIPEKMQQDFDPKDGLIEVGVYELAVAFQEALKRSQKIVHHIDADEITIEEKVAQIVAILKESTDQSVDFKHVLPKTASRIHWVVSFMAILELTRLQCIRLYQANFESAIHIRRTEKLASFDLEKVYTHPEILSVHKEGSA
jgi:segregation and condensation protein A